MPAEEADNEALIAMMPFAAQLGIRLDEASPERVVATLDWAPELCTTASVMHGGVLMSLADTTGALVVFLGLAEGETTATITSTTQVGDDSNGPTPHTRRPQRPNAVVPDGLATTATAQRCRSRRAGNDSNAALVE